MKKNLNFYLIVLIILICSCNKDEVNNQVNIQEVRNESNQVLTSGSKKVWRIEKAKLIANNNDIDISSNFNIIDDEFIFELAKQKSSLISNGTLTWVKNFDVETSANNSSETLIDKYVSSVSSSFKYANESGTIIETDFGTFEVKKDGSVFASINNDDGSKFSFTLTEKKQSDYPIPPTNGLNFSKSFSFKSNGVAGYSPGMIGSYSKNSFFLVTREGAMVENGVRPERVLKFDLNTNTISEKLFFQSDFVSKQLHIIGNELVVIGGQYVNIYDLNLSSNPRSVKHGKGLSRFGISVLDDDAYIIGGDLDGTELNKVFKWDINNQKLSEFTTLPEPKSGARGTIVNNHLYVFGGSEKFYGSNPTNTIYKINVSNPSQIENFKMNKKIDFSFVQKYQNLIYVAGNITKRDSNGTQIGSDSTIGVFNTLDNSYKELSTNLVQNKDYETIHQMCIFNSKMYIIYGQRENTTDKLQEWNVLVSDLN